MTAATQPYPDNSRSEWVRRWLVEPVYGLDGLLRFAYEVSARAGEKPFLLNSHKAMVRETHQRIRLNAAGEMMHMSGIAVPELDVEEFLLTDRRAYRWVSPWQDARGRTLTPFIFPTYRGTPEALDPQWQREMVVIPQAQQVEELIAQYLTGAEARRLSGDHRGTTLELQVGAGADDGRVYNGVTRDASDATSIYGPGKTSLIQETWHRFTGSFPTLGDTVNIATFSHYTFLEVGTGANTNVLVSADDQAGATAPTTAADFNGRTRTATQVAWNNINTTSNQWHELDVQSVIAELVASYALTAIQVLTDENGGAASNHHRSRSYEYDSTLAAKLHIEYTAAGGGGAVRRRVGIGSGGYALRR
ncbi:MAG TPA: hypothetical protein VJM51_00350 [Dehalococcoidia bacterium]|nr:hypothetical protein [Dehalococcoidia bacterium]